MAFEMTHQTPFLFYCYCLRMWALVVIYDVAKALPTLLSQFQQLYNQASSHWRSSYGRIRGDVSGQALLVENAAAQIVAKIREPILSRPENGTRLLPAERAGESVQQRTDIYKRLISLVTDQQTDSNS
jgi:hypothetical protein